ncbi:MAG: hypothetical protein J6V01_03200, partial [Clostridia bacterium]|nr:hypothetical protein [Clostridia bacterium]
KEPAPEKPENGDAGTAEQKQPSDAGKSSAAEPDAPVRMSEWPDVLELFRRSAPGVSALLGTSAAYLSREGGKTVVTVRYRTEVSRMLASAPETLAKLCAALSSVTGGVIGPENVKFEQGVPDDAQVRDELLEDIGRVQQN